jgi:uncharacterized membrane protein YkoI
MQTRILQPRRLVWAIALLAASAIAFAAASAGPARADDWDHDRDHDRARAALQRGEVLPLATILERLASVIDGEIIAAEFDRDDGLWLYEIEYIDQDGRVVELVVNAADARVLEREVD